MGREQVLFKSEEKMSSSETAALLRSIADKVEKGRKKTTKKLEIEIEWVVGGVEQAAVKIK